MQIFSTLVFQFRGDSQWGAGRRIAHLSLWIGGLLAASLSGLAPPLQAQSDPRRPIQATDLYRMQEVRDLSLSPTGRFVAYTVRQIVTPPDGAARSEAVHRTHLYVTPTSGRSDPRLLTRHGNGGRKPTWHPDGTHVAFVRPVDGTPQLFVLSLSGGEPYQLTHFPYGVHNPQWSPDGERLLFASNVPEPALARVSARPVGSPPSERPGRHPGDLVRTRPPDTILVLRSTRTLNPVDTLTLGPQGRLRLRADTARALRTPGPDLARDTLAHQVTGHLGALSADSLRVVLDSLRLRPDTTTVSVAPDTAATPTGSRIQVRRWLHQSQAHGAALVSTRPDLQGERDLRPTPTYRHHFVVDVPSGLQSGTPPRPSPRPVTGGHRSYGRAEWLPGSGQIVVSGTPRSSRHIDRIRQRNLYVVDLNQRRMQRLLRIDDYALTEPRVTSSGSTVAFRAQPLSPTRDDQTEVGLFALDGRSAPRLISTNLDRDVETIRWSPEGWYLYATAPSRGGIPIYRFSPFAADTSGRPSMSPDRATSRDTFALDSTMVRPAPYRIMTTSTRAVHDFAVTTASVVYAATDPDTPSALYTNTVSFNNERRLSAHNAEWLSRRRLATPFRLTARPDSLRINGWVTRPPWAADSAQHPLLVQVRGGPSDLHSLHTPEAWFERQYLAARGFGLVEVLPRGSAGYGTAFRRANDTNWGPGPAQDVLAVADSAAALPWIDASQQALTGTSYGGTLTAWLLGQTDRFEAAVALNGIYDLSSLLDAGRAWRLVPQEFGGYPWEGTPLLRTGPPVLSIGPRLAFNRRFSPWRALHRNAPLSHVEHIDTPLLLLQGGADRRVGPAQGERLYKRLKILGRPVEYVRYPGVGHDVAATATPGQRLDRLVRTYEFLDRFLPAPSQRPPSGDEETR